MFSKVLLPVDLNHTEAASSAINAAQKIVETSGGDLHVISVTPDFGMAMVGEFFPEGFERKMLEKASADLKPSRKQKFQKKLRRICISRMAMSQKKFLMLRQNLVLM